MKYLLFLLMGCASAGEWQEVFVDPKLVEPRPCTIERDGQEFSGKGWCWQGKVCKDRFLRSDKCVPKPYFCKYGDEQCLKDKNWHLKKLVHDE